MASAATPTPESTESVSSIGRVGGALFSPRTTFESIARRPTWVVPLLLLTLMSIIVTALFSQRVGWRTFMEHEIATNASAQRRMEQVPADQKDQVLDQQAKFAGVIGYVAAVLGPILGAVVVAAVLLGAFNLLIGAKTTFGTALSIVSYSWVPLLIHGLLGIVILFVKDPSTIDIKNLVASNPGALLSEDSAKWLVTLLTSLDVFAFWVMALQAFGFSATNPKKISFGKAFGTIFAVWLVYVLVRVGFAAAFS
jgi:hypothetical protein